MIAGEFRIPLKGIRQLSASQPVLTHPGEGRAGVAEDHSFAEFPAGSLTFENVSLLPRGGVLILI